MKKTKIVCSVLILILFIFFTNFFAYAEPAAEPIKDTATVEFSPSIAVATVHGDKEKFEEDHWISRNSSGGINKMSFFKNLNKQDSLEFEGRAIAGNNDFATGLNFSREGLGSLIIDFKEFRKYYDGTGGFYSHLIPTAKSPLTYGELDNDLHLDIGNFKVEGILAKEDSPEYTFAYERESRNGKKSLLGWGTVNGGLPISPKIYPTFLQVDEWVNKFKIGIKHATKDTEVSAEQKWENARNENQHIVGQTYTLSTGAISSVRTKFENTDSDLYTTVLRYSKDLNKKVFVSCGLLFNHYIGGSIEQATDTSTVSYNENHPPNPARVEQNSVTLLPNVSFSPFKDLLMGAGLKAEVITTNGNATYNRDYRTSATNFTPDGTIDEFVNIVSALDQKKFSENFQLKYSGLENAVFYADNEFGKQFITHHEIQDAFGPNPAAGLNFERKTDTRSFNNNFTLGSKWYPVSKINITAEYKYKNEFKDNNHEILLGDVVNGYNGYITHMDFVTHAPVLKLNYKPYRWLAYNLGYTYDATTYNVRTRASATTETARYKANIYSGDITLAPVDYFYCSLFYQRRDAMTKTRASTNSADLSVTQPIFNADVDVLGMNYSYALSKSTTLTGGYSMYRANDFNDFSETGLPLGVDNFSQDISLGLKRALNKDRSLEFKYTYSKYNENSNNNIDDYEAHLIYAAMNMAF